MVLESKSSQAHNNIYTGTTDSGATRATTLTVELRFNKSTFIINILCFRPAKQTLTVTSSAHAGGKYILFEAKLKARNPKESTPLNNIRWKKNILVIRCVQCRCQCSSLRSALPCSLLQVSLLPCLRYCLPSLPVPRVVVPAK